MPIQENSGVLRSESAIKKGKTSATLAKEALAVGKQNTNAISEPTPNEMTKQEALAVLWTGVESLVQMKTANLYHSPRTGRVWIELLAVNYSEKEGLLAISKE